MPTPSVMLCSVKPTTRNAPRAASPRANAAPMASPSQVVESYPEGYPVRGAEPARLLATPP